MPNKFLEDWEFEGKKSRFSDRFSGYSVFVSRSNPDFKTSLVVRRTDGKGNEGPGPALCRAIYASPSWAAIGTRC